MALIKQALQHATTPLGYNVTLHIKIKYKKSLVRTISSICELKGLLMMHPQIPWKTQM
jgi:hypothetical protein